MPLFIDNKRPGVVLHVHNIQKAAEWYKEMLGFSIGPHDYNAFAEMFMDGDYLFHLGQASESMRPFAVPAFGFYSHDIELAYAELQSQGVQVGEMSWFPDYSAFTFYDLEGNAISLSQHFQIRFKELDAHKLVGLRIPLEQQELHGSLIQQTNQALKLRLPEIGNVLNSTQLIGVYTTDANSNGQTSYWACVKVKEFEQIPQGMETLTIPEQKYAVKWYYGLPANLPQTFTEMHQLLQKAGYTLPQYRTRLEINHNRGEAEEAEVELYLYEAVTQ